MGKRILDDPQVARKLGELLRLAASRAPESHQDRTVASKNKWLSTKARIGFRVVAITVCGAIIGIGLPDFRDQPLDFWIPMAAFVLAVLTAAWHE